MYSQYCQGFLVIVTSSFCFEVMGECPHRGPVRQKCLYGKLLSVQWQKCLVLGTRSQFQHLLPSEEKVGVTLPMHAFFLQHVTSSVCMCPQRHGFPNGTQDCDESGWPRHLTALNRNENFLGGIKTICLHHGLLGMRQDSTLNMLVTLSRWRVGMWNMLSHMLKIFVLSLHLKIGIFFNYNELERGNF